MGTHYSGTPEEILALDTYIKLTRAAESLAQRINMHLASHQLTISQFGALEALYHLGAMDHHTLAGKILKSTGNMTLVIDNLEKRGLVGRQRDTHDRRKQVIHLTPAGKALMDEIIPTHVTAITREMSVLTQSQQTLLGQLCKAIGLAQPTPISSLEETR